MLARGIDRTDGFIHYAPPTRLFDPTFVELYEEVRREQSKVLAAGLKAGKVLYG